MTSSSSTLLTPTTSMNFSLLALPPEIIINILLFLPAPSVLRCKGVNHYLQDLISDSVEVQYYIRCEIAGQLDNYQCHLSVNERLDQLLIKEDRWQELTLDFEKTFEVPFMTSGIYDLTGGVYLLGHSSRKSLHYTYLPSEPDQEVVWKEIYSDQTIIDMGLCVYEHDLLAIITTQPAVTDQPDPSISHEIRLHLNQVSTGLRHPEAKQPVISVMNTPWERPAVGIEIVGDNLVLILAYYENPRKPEDRVFVYEWKTGRLKMKISAPYHSYAGLLFLTHDIFLLPNTNTGTLEYWRIPQNTTETAPQQPFFVLALPQLSQDRTFGHISCRAEPNPTANAHYSPKPFYADPRNAIAIFSVAVRSGIRPELPPIFHHHHFSSAFVFFVHRSSLLDCLVRFLDYVSEDNEPRAVPYSSWGESICRWFAAEVFPTRWVTTTAGQRCVIIPDMGTESNRAPIILLNFNQMDVAKVLVAEKCDREERIRQDAQKTKERIDRASRHRAMNQGEGSEGINGDDDDEDYDEELVDPLSESGDDGDSEGISDPPSTDSVAEEQQPSHPQPRHRRRVKAMRLSDALDDSQRCFASLVYSSLPYTVCSTRKRHAFHGVLLDEERILGLRTNVIQRITNVHIFHYG